MENSKKIGEIEEMATYIIEQKTLTLDKRGLLCEWVERNENILVDLFEKKCRLYHTTNGNFAVAIYLGEEMMDGYPKIISKKDAMMILSMHPDGIDTEVYERRLGVSGEW